ncbi:MAG: glycoside hydrolase [Actinobacteria bacterium]|nr:glycoside hydrolase [Actinomycetota bacterium]
MKRVLSVLGASLAIALVLVPSAGAALAPVSVSPNVQVNTRDPTLPTQDFRSPVIAINPTNANNIVIASRSDEPDYFCWIHYSLDGGATWTAATGTGPKFPDPPLPAGSPSSKTSGTCWSPGVAFDASGNVYVVAQDRPNLGGQPTTVIIWKSTDGGKTFGAPLTIPPSTTSRFSVQADVAIDTTPTSPFFGRIYVTWHEGPNFSALRATLTYSNDGGQTWSSPIKRATSGQNVPEQNQQLPDLTVAPDGTVYDIFKTAGPFGGTGDCAGIGGGSPPASGTNCPIQVLRSSNGGASFDGDPVTVGTTFFPGGPENAVVATAVAEEPSILVTPSGTLLVAAATVPNPPASGCTASLQAVFYRSTDRGQTWSAPKTLNDDACASGNEHRDPRLSVAPNGRIDAAFYDNRLDPAHQLFDVQYANSTDDGLTFGPNTRLTDKSFPGEHLFKVRPPGSPPNSFQTRDYDTVTGLASTDTAVIGAWGDTRNDPANSNDVWSGRISFVAPQPPPPSGGPPPPVPGPGPGITPSPTLPTLAEIAKALKLDISELVKALKKLGLDGILKQGGFTQKGFDAQTTGKLNVDVTTVAAKKTKAARASATTKIARGAATFSKPGTYNVKVKLTSKGKKALKKAKRLKVKVTMTFTDSAARVTKSAKSVTLNR